MNKLPFSDENDMFAYTVSKQRVDPTCLRCGKITHIDQKSTMALCEGCGAVLLNPDRMVDKSAQHIKPLCYLCDDTGLVRYPVSGDVLYIACLRCICDNGNKVSKKIPKVPPSMLEAMGSPEARSFMGQRKAIHDAQENYRQQLRKERQGYIDSQKGDKSE